MIIITIIIIIIIIKNPHWNNIITLYGKTYIVTKDEKASLQSQIFPPDKKYISTGIILNWDFKKANLFHTSNLRFSIIHSSHKKQTQKYIFIRIILKWELKKQSLRHKLNQRFSIIYTFFKKQGDTMPFLNGTKLSMLLDYLIKFSLY